MRSVERKLRKLLDLHYADRIDIESIWQTATAAEKRTLIEDLIESVLIHHDRLVVHVTGAPHAPGHTGGSRPAHCEYETKRVGGRLVP